MSLETKYLGITLRNPLIVGSSSLTDDVATVRELEDEGAAALVLRSLYEEQITGEQMDAFFQGDSHDDSSAEAGSYQPDPELAPGPDEYLEHLQREEGGWYSRDRLSVRHEHRKLGLVRASAGTSRRRRESARCWYRLLHS